MKLLRLRPFVVHETPDDTGTGEPTPPAEPTTPAPEAAPTPAPTGDAPWAKDLAQMFPDEAIRGQVDTFLRGHVQPHVTRVEQEYAPARELYTALQSENSLETYLGLAEQLYGEEVAEALAQVVIDKYGSDEEETVAEPETDTSNLPPHIQKMYEEWEATRAKEQYWAEMERVKKADARVDPDLFHPFVLGADGDFDQALSQYQAWHAQAYPEAPSEEAPAPPATLGDDHVGHAPPPVQPHYDSLDDALDATLNEMRANRNPPPPTVGAA